MGSIRDKLRSQRGASILLALLFFLVCAMVGASVLMAAASNAGKSRSSREEQQKYLTLSSAMQLVCDELTAAKYIGTYDYSYRTEQVQIGVDLNGNPVYQTHIYHEYTQTVGVSDGGFVCELSGILPLTQELDELFSTEFPSSYVTGTTHYVYAPKYINPSLAVTTRALTLTVQEQADKPVLSKPVIVKVRLERDETYKYRLSLTAFLQEDPDYIMYAALINSGRPALSASPRQGANTCEITWSLSEITRKEPTTW